MPEPSIDYQEIRTYLEIAPAERFSVFGEVPVRFINPTTNDNQQGLGDVNAGAKFAFLYSEDTVATAQIRVQAPTGDPGKGLGTSDWWLEPGVLFYQRLTERLFLEAEVRDYIPVNTGHDFAGNVVRYGVGLSFLLYDSPGFRIVPVGEAVGWTVLNGKQTDFNNVVPIQDAAGTTIVNAKMGVRVGFGQYRDQPGFLNRADIYLGYARALTGNVWYEDLARAELRVRW